MTHIFIAECLQLANGCKYLAFIFVPYNIVIYCCNNYFPHIWNIGLHIQIFMILYIYIYNSFAFLSHYPTVL